MIGKQIRLSTFGFVVLALAALACALPGFGSSGPVIDASDSGGDEDVPLSYSGLGTGNLASYRAKYTLNFVGTDESGAPVDMNYAVNQAYSREQNASSFVAESGGTGLPKEAANITLTQMGDTTYMVSGDDCLAFAGGEGVLEEQAISPEDALTGADLSGAKRVLPNENVNGIMTRHYRFTENDISLVGTGFTNATGDIWVAVDGGYVVRQQVSADGTSDLFGSVQGHLEWTYELLEANVPVSIEAPPGCEAPGADVPAIPDATELSAVSGLVTYKTASPVADVVAFYQDVMPAQGWTAGTASTDVPGLATLAYTRDGETASILISEGEGGSDVLITVE